MENELSNSEKKHKQLNKHSYFIYEKYFTHVRKEIDYLNAEIQLSESQDAVLFNSLFLELFEVSIKEEYFWSYCDFKTYRNNHNKRLNEFIKQYGPDVNEIDFIEQEKKIIENGFLSYSFPFNDYPSTRASIDISFLDQKIQKRLTYSKNKKLKFLEAELDRIEKQPEYYSDYFENTLPPNYIRDLKNRNEILAGFITSTDDANKLEFLPYSDFIKKYNELTESEQIPFLFELKRIINNGAISKAYLLNEWEGINLKEFVNSQLESIDRINELETEMQNNKLNDSDKRVNHNSSIENNTFKNENSIPPELFTPEGEEIFLYLKNKYQSDNKFLPTKFSNIYRVMDEFNFIIGTQDQYKNYIKSEFDVTLSKIMNNEYKESNKFQEKRKPYLIQLIKKYNKQD